MLYNVTVFDKTLWCSGENTSISPVLGEVLSSILARCTFLCTRLDLGMRCTTVEPVEPRSGPAPSSTGSTGKTGPRL